MFSISVIIPSYNRLHTLPRAIDSVLNQSVPVHELIVVDDGSTDGTVEYIKQHYSTIRLISQSQRGVSAARNVGIASAKGQWIALLDSDDEWLPDKIAKQQQKLQQLPDSKICHTEEIWVRNGKRVNAMQKHKKTGGWIYENCLPLCAMSPSSIVFHCSVLQAVGLFDEALPACEDYDLWLRICNQFPVIFIEEPCIIKYGGHEDQLSRQYWGMDRFRITALDKILQSPALQASNRPLTLAMLQKKITVYIKGAEKRQKTAEVTEYRKLLSRYGLNES